MTNKTFYIEILGCKVNAYEAESVRNDMLDKGYVEVKHNEVADIYILFTCAVTNTAESKTRKKINQLIRLNKDAVLVVVGCYVQIHQDLLQENPDIDILVGSVNKDKIVGLVEGYLENHQKKCIAEDVSLKAKFDYLPITSFAHKSRAYLKIQDGCNQFCSYCIIPYSRGRERSIEFDEAIRQAKILAKSHDEIILTGIHTGRYGNNTDYNLVDLIKELLKIENLKRIRTSSIEITEIDDELIDLIASNDKMAKFLHIPLQSGNNKQLEMMNRPYTTEEFKNRVDYIRSKIPGISISTDLIVGFAGETEDDFNKTVEFIKEVGFSFIHCFPYAVKTGTKAEKFTGQLDNGCKKQRVRIINNISNDLYNEYKKTFIGKTISVILETNKDGKLFGHSSEYLPVSVEGNANNNTIVNVKVIELTGEELKGIILEA